MDNMTIKLPESLESPILAAVHSGRYASLDDAMADAASLLVQRLRQEQTQDHRPVTSEAEVTPKYKPIWEVAEDIRKSIPIEEWEKLPADGAEQLDHYLYGTPKRPKQ
jgi:Arc/MetJ-type ribon-helix-helix transcriptional regulator